MKVICPYCNQQAKLVTGEIIYPHRKDLYNLYFYQCKPCKAYVGTHKSNKQPLGRLANESLRKAKQMAHKAFDPIWKEGNLSRKDAYKWLTKVMKIDKKDCHIGMFNEDMCAKVIIECNKQASIEMNKYLTSTFP